MEDERINYNKLRADLRDYPNDGAPYTDAELAAGLQHLKDYPAYYAQHRPRSYRGRGRTFDSHPRRVRVVLEWYDTNAQRGVLTRLAREYGVTPSRMRQILHSGIWIIRQGAHLQRVAATASASARGSETIAGQQ